MDQNVEDMIAKDIEAMNPIVKTKGQIGDITCLEKNIVVRIKCLSF